MLPQEKLNAIARQKAAGHKVLMVGDGLNDGPALAAGYASIAPASASDAGALNCRTTSGQATIGVRPGGTFVARVSLSSDLPLVYNSAIFRLVLTGGVVCTVVRNCAMRMRR